MHSWPVADYLMGFLAFCFQSVPSILILYLLSRWWRRSGSPVVAESKAPADWSTIGSYVELSEAARDAQDLEPGQFLDGPFRRFLELASEPAPYNNPRGAARVMEFARGTFIEYLHSQAERGAHVAEIRARGRRMTAEWPNWPNVIHGEYMLEVFDGYSNHNYRGKPDPACEHFVKAKAGD